MTLRANIEYSGFTPKAPQRKINNALRFAYDQLGVEFFDTNLPRRFTHNGALTLGYQKRTNAYNARKQRETGQREPMVYSGETRSRVLSYQYTRVNATAKGGVGGVALTLNAPVLNFRRSNNAPDLRDEITRVAQREVPPLERKLDKFITTQFNELTDSQKQKIG